MGGEFAESSEPTELAGVAEAQTESAYAWALDDGEEDEPERQWPFLVTAIAVGLSMSLATIAGVLAYRHFETERSTAAAVSTPAITTTVSPLPVAAPAPPPPPPPVTVTTVVVQEPPRTVIQQAPAGQLPPPALVEGYDQQLYNTLQSRGILIPSREMMARDAHLVCARLQQGQSVSQIQQDYAAVSQGNMAIASIFVSSVTAIYPNCP